MFFFLYRTVLIGARHLRVVGDILTFVIIGSNKGKEIMATVGDIWIQLFSCCFQSPQSPHRPVRRHHQRLKIDRSMIGHPTNFVHTGHIGSTDVELSSHHLNMIQTQMQSKGGYEAGGGAIRLSGNYEKIKVKKIIFFLF